MKGKRTNPRRVPATAADVNKAKKQATEYAIAQAWSIFFTVLRDKEGYEIEDLARVWREIEDLSDSVSKGYCTIADLRNVLRQEMGAVLVD